MAKELWEMTQQEYVDSREYLYPRGHPAELANLKAQVRRTHQFRTREALEEGKPVPTRVLKDYPGLEKKETESKGIPTEILEEAKGRKQWASKVLEDKEWLAKASSYSKDTAAKYAKMTVQELAKDIWAYLGYRGTATDEVFGQVVYIDKPARDRYLRLLQSTGKPKRKSKPHKHSTPPARIKGLRR